MAEVSYLFFVIRQLLGRNFDNVLVGITSIFLDFI